MFLSNIGFNLEFLAYKCEIWKWYPSFFWLLLFSPSCLPIFLYPSEFFHLMLSSWGFPLLSWELNSALKKLVIFCSAFVVIWRQKVFQNIDSTILSEIEFPDTILGITSCWVRDPLLVPSDWSHGAKVASCFSGGAMEGVLNLKRKELGPSFALRSCQPRL